MSGCNSYKIHVLQLIVNRLMLDQSMFKTSDELKFYSDASAAENLGYGCIFNNRWIYSRWENNFISSYKPSIEFLELYALCTGVLMWQKRSGELYDHHFL